MAAAVQHAFTPQVSVQEPPNNLQYPVGAQSPGQVQVKSSNIFVSSLKITKYQVIPFFTSAVRPSVSHQNLVIINPSKRLDGLGQNSQEIFLKVSRCASDKKF